MNFETVPSIYLQPRVIILDQDSDFIDPITAVLCDTIAIETCQNEQELFKYISKDHKIEDILMSCYLEGEEGYEVSSFKTIRTTLDYQALAKKIYAYYRANEFISIVCIGDDGIASKSLDILKQLKSLPISRIFMNKTFTASELLHALQEGWFHKVVNKQDENLSNVLETLIIKEHSRIIQTLNSELFGRFCKYNSYAGLFLHEPFIRFFENILSQQSIIFSCVYESGGSLFMSDYAGNAYLLNIYSLNELKHILFESVEFEESFSDYNKDLCREFKLLVNYKNNESPSLLDPFLSDKITDMFREFLVGDKIYYVTLSSSKQNK